MLDFFEKCLEQNLSGTIGVFLGIGITISLIIVAIKSRIPAIFR